MPVRMDQRGTLDFQQKKLKQRITGNVLIGHLELGTWNLELGTWNLELGTWNLEPKTQVVRVA